MHHHNSAVCIQQMSRLYHHCHCHLYPYHLHRHCNYQIYLLIIAKIALSYTLMMLFHHCTLINLVLSTNRHMLLAVPPPINVQSLRHKYTIIQPHLMHNNNAVIHNPVGNNICVPFVNTTNSNNGSVVNRNSFTNRNNSMQYNSNSVTCMSSVIPIK